MRIIAATAALTLCTAIYATSTTEDGDEGYLSFDEVLMVIEDHVDEPSAREQLQWMVQDLAALAESGLIDEYNSVMDEVPDIFWSMTEEDLTLSYEQRDVVFAALMSAACAQQSGTTKWEVTDRVPGKKCKTPRTATCEKKKHFRCVMKIKKIKVDGQWVEATPRDERCESESTR